MLSSGGHLLSSSRSTVVVGGGRFFSSRDRELSSASRVGAKRRYLSRKKHGEDLDREKQQFLYTYTMVVSATEM